MSKMTAIREWRIPGKIITGTCTLVVHAETKEEAAAKFVSGEWWTEDGEWECEPDFDVNDDKELMRNIEGD